jgi:hypothetical protein
MFYVILNSHIYSHRFLGVGIIQKVFKIFSDVLPHYLLALVWPNDEEKKNNLIAIKLSLVKNYFSCFSFLRESFLCDIFSFCILFHQENEREKEKFFYN